MKQQKKCAKRIYLWVSWSIEGKTISKIREKIGAWKLRRVSWIFLKGKIKNESAKIFFPEKVEVPKEKLVNQKIKANQLLATITF